MLTALDELFHLIDMLTEADEAPGRRNVLRHLVRPLPPATCEFLLELIEHGRPEVVDG